MNFNRTAEVTECLFQVIDALKPQERLVIEHLYFDGMTGAQVAKQLAVSPCRIYEVRKAALVKLRHAAPVILGLEELDVTRLNKEWHQQKREALHAEWYEERHRAGNSMQTTD